MHCAPGMEFRCVDFPQAVFPHKSAVETLAVTTPSYGLLPLVCLPSRPGQNPLTCPPFCTKLMLHTKMPSTWAPSVKQKRMHQTREAWKLNQGEFRTRLRCWLGPGYPAHRVCLVPRLPVAASTLVHYPGSPPRAALPLPALPPTMRHAMPEGHVFPGVSSHAIDKLCLCQMVLSVSSQHFRCFAAVH